MLWNTTKHSNTTVDTKAIKDLSFLGKRGTESTHSTAYNTIIVLYKRRGALNEWEAWHKTGLRQDKTKESTGDDLKW